MGWNPFRSGSKKHGKSWEPESQAWQDRHAGGNLPNIFAAGAENYIRNLKVLRAGLRASAAGLISPALQTQVASILSQHGMATDELGKALMTGALTIPTLEADAAAGTVAKELSDFQTAIAQARAGAPRAPSVGATAIEGAATGFATGGPIGAVFGGIGGILRGKQGKTGATLVKRALADATRLASPENFAANLEKVTNAAREETFVQGQQAELAGRANVSRAGAVGTGIGTQAQISAGVAPQVAALRSAIGTASSVTGNEVSARLGTPVRPPKTTLVDALGAAAGIAGAVLSPEAARRRRLAQLSGSIDTTVSQPTIGDVANYPGAGLPPR